MFSLTDFIREIYRDNAESRVHDINQLMHAMTLTPEPRGRIHLFYAQHNIIFTHAVVTVSPRDSYYALVKKYGVEVC